MLYSFKFSDLEWLGVVSELLKPAFGIVCNPIAGVSLCGEIVHLQVCPVGEGNHDDPLATEFRWSRFKPNVGNRLGHSFNMCRFGRVCHPRLGV